MLDVDVDELLLLLSENEGSFSCCNADGSKFVIVDVEDEVA
jgi:hypothetical protein